MALTIGNALSPRMHSSGAGQRSVAALQAQLAQYQKLLSDCVNCSSSSTSQGRAQIQALNTKIEALRSQISAIGAAKANDQASSVQPLPVMGRSEGSGLYGAYGSDRQGRRSQAQAGAGRLLDVYA